MYFSLRSLCAAAVIAVCAATGFAQDYNAMNAAFNAQLNAQMNAGVNNIVQTNMNNPYIRQQYQVYRAQGGTLDFPSYCYRWAETGGFNPQATRNMINTSNSIHNEDMNRYRAYADHSRLVRQETYDYRNSVQDRWAHQRGEGLSAQAPFVNSATGQQYTLPTNLWPGQTYHDRVHGNVFYLDPNGQYWMNSGNGWQSMYYQQ
jgi:hypothetical protein